MALQWDGAAWGCINIASAGLSGGEANGYEVKDDWGDIWDGLARSARPWDAARQACEDDGARLPTVTEIWRNRASFGTANIATVNDNYYHWTNAPSYRENYHMMVYLSNNARTDWPDTSAGPFRCIWKSQTPTGFTGNRCFGAPGSECLSLNAFYNIDSRSRSRQYMASAISECELENAYVATSNDMETAIQKGLPYVSQPDDVWPQWHYTANASHYSNNFTYQKVMRWNSTPEPWWGPITGNANISTASTPYMFRCVGKKDPNSNFVPPSPSCENGNCFTPSVARRNRLTADNTDRVAKTWIAAAEDCRSEGAALPSFEEFHQLVNAGWENGSLNYLWTRSPATWGWQIYRWRDTGSDIWSATTIMKAPTTTLVRLAPRHLPDPTAVCGVRPNTRTSRHAQSVRSKCKTHRVPIPVRPLS